MTAVLQLIAVCAEGVGIHYLRACVDIHSVDIFYHIRVSKIEQLGDLPCFKSAFLEHGSHGSVKEYKFIL